MKVCGTGFIIKQNYLKPCSAEKQTHTCVEYWKGIITNQSRKLVQGQMAIYMVKQT